MDRKKVIKKIAVPAAIIFVISVIILMLQIPIRNIQYENQLEKREIYFEEFSKEQEAYLKNIADKIKNNPVSKEIIEKLKDECNVTRSQRGKAKRAFWTTNRRGAVGEVLAKSKNFDSLPKIDHGYLKSINPEFSAPTLQGNFKIKMIVNDYANRKMYYDRNMLEEEDLYSVLNPIFGILSVLSGLFLWFLLPTWVYSDAQERDVKNPEIWAFLTLVSLFYGLTVYLITRPTKTKSFHCPKCKEELNGTLTFCPHCGNDLSSTFCHECQYPIKPTWKFCPNCRSNLSTGEPTTFINNEKEGE